MCKKIIFTILVVALALSLSIFVGAAEITSANDMLVLMNTPSMWNDDYVLTTSINLAEATNGLSQQPIGYVGNGADIPDTPFTGTFDGNGNTIYGINISGDTRVGLFGFAANATIENLTIYGTVAATGNVVGGFVGHVDTAAITIENCVNYCTVSGYDAVGGIIGRVETNSSIVYINKCINYGTITAAYRYAAGIAGFHSQSKGASATIIENCINAGSISATTAYAGGISGYWRVYQAASDKCFIQDCLNTGSITAGSSGYAGGIIGYGSKENGRYTITRCLNTGSITSSKYTRPIAGTVSAATNTAGNFNNCYYTSTDKYTTDNYGAETYVADFSNAQGFAGLGGNWILADGRTPEIKALHTHNYKYVVAGKEHSQVCYCGNETAKEAHSFADGVCSKCGAEDIPCAHENKYEIVETVATCTAKGCKYEFCPDCNIKVSDNIEIEINQNNHASKLTMGYANGAVTYTCVCGAVAYTDNSLLDTVYVSENGNELFGNVTAQIGTQTNPFKNFTDAMLYAAYCGKDVTVTILDNATTPAAYETPSFDSTITVTGGTLTTNNRFVMNGKFVFEHIKIAPSVTLVMAAKEHKLVMGEGITMSGSGIYLVGGYEKDTCSNADIPATGYTSDITLRSGSYHAVGGGNRYLNGKYSGTIKITLGAKNAKDTLEITSTFTTASMNYDGGDGVNATVIIDGPVHINSLCPVTHVASASGRFDIDFVVQGKATTDVSKLYWRGNDYTVTVYADNRTDGAEEFAASLVGAENVHPYKRYCLKVNGAHPDANADAICDNCGSSTACEHECGEWQETAAANCANAAVYTWYCFDCKELIEGATKNGEFLDSENHISDSFVWQYADGKYFFTCTACGVNVGQISAPAVYVSALGNNALDGMTAEKAVATVEEAVSRIAKTGGTVMICGEYPLASNLILPAYEKEITISGTDNAGEYGSFVISKNVVITLGGKTKFDKIGFGGSAVYTFACMWNDTAFGTVQPYGTATANIVLGRYSITENDTENESATLTITEGTSQRIAAARYVDRFYSYVYLGDTFGAEGVSVANKTATFNATNADIGVLYTMSTSAKYKNAPVSACETTVNLYGATKVDKGRTGDYNVGYAESTASLKKQTLNFFDSSYIGSNYYIKNAENTLINVSTSAEGREIPIRCPFTFYAYGTFANNSTQMNVEINYGTHSFASVVETPCTYTTAANVLKVHKETKTNECEYTPKVTVAATPTEKGTKLYSCTCGRKYTEEYTYSCADATHFYLAKADGSYVCTVCGASFATTLGNNQFALSPVTVSRDSVELVLSVNAAEIAAAKICVTAPAGFAFSSISIPEVEGFYVCASESEPCTITLLSTTGTSVAIGANIALTYSVAETVTPGDHVFTVAITEAYNADGESVVATPVSAAATVVGSTVYVAQIRDVKYVTLADAFAASVEGDTITALEKITVVGDEVWDLTGKTLVLAELDGTYALVVKGNLTINGGNFVSNGEYGIGVTGMLIINDGAFTSSHPESYLIGTWGNTIINDGIFKSVYNNVNGFAGKLAINGGNFTVAGYTGEYDSADILAEENVVSVYGGTFSSDPSAFVAKGYEAVETDGVYGIIEKEAQEVVGDIDGDGSVTINDVLKFIRAVLNNETVENGDLNGDGKASLIDILRVLKLVSQ